VFIVLITGETDIYEVTAGVHSILERDVNDLHVEVYFPSSANVPSNPMIEEAFKYDPKSNCVEYAGGVLSENQYLSDEQLRKLLRYVKKSGDLARRRGSCRPIINELIILIMTNGRKKLRN